MGGALVDRKPVFLFSNLFGNLSLLTQNSSNSIFSIDPFHFLLAPSSRKIQKCV